MNTGHGHVPSARFFVLPRGVRGEKPPVFVRAVLVVLAVTAVLVHPTGVGNQPQARRNWAGTILNEVAFTAPARADALRPGQLSALLAAHPSGAAHFWGTPAHNAQPVSRLSPGDLVIFTGKNQVQAAARIGVLLNNERFADSLWPRDAEGRSFRHVYSVLELRFLDLSYDELRRLGGFSVKEPFRRVKVVEDGQARQLVAAFDVARLPGRSPGARRTADLHPRPALVTEAAPAHEPPAGGQPGVAGRPALADDVAPELRKLDQLAAFTGSTDGAAVVRAARNEQKVLRKALGLGPDAAGAVQCGLCSRHFPRQLLVAAHIKPRSECTEEERQALTRVAMAACLLGCDALFEAGYIAVDGSGRILTARRDLAPSALQTLLRELERRRAPAWNEAREVHFAWHRDHTFVGSPVPTRG